MFSRLRFNAVLRARNIEFLRDRTALAWNIIFPILLVAGFAFLSNDSTMQFKVGVYNANSTHKMLSFDPASTPFTAQHEFFKNRLVQFVQIVPTVDVKDLSEAVDKLKHHQYDMLIDLSANPGARQDTRIKYWVNSSSQKSEILEKMLWGSVNKKAAHSVLEKQMVSAQEIRYIDWLLPGILALNMMFSCLFGIGYTIVRYRKTGVLKRFKGTPLTAFEFLAAQVVSRLMLVMFATIVVFIGSSLLIDFKMAGSYFSLFLIFLLGAMCLISLALIIAARTTSEEFANGILNLLAWPMIIFSGIWFSLAGLHPVGQTIAYVLPLTHLIEAARQVMNDGHGLVQIMDHLLILGLMTAVFLAIGVLGFKWDRF